MSAEYACLDGSPFPVTFADPGDLEYRWSLDREHAPAARTPLADAVAWEGRAGGVQAYAECEVLMLSRLRRKPPLANGFDYVVADPDPEAERTEFGAGLARLARQHGGSWPVWAAHCLPRVQEAWARLADPPPGTRFEALAAEHRYAWSHTSVAGAVTYGNLLAVADCCRPLYGDQATFVAHQLAQGFANDTIAANVELAQVAGQPRGSAAAGGRDRFLEAYGAQSTSWSIDHPTLAEQPEVVDAQLRMLQGAHHRAVEPAAADRRRRLATDIAARLDGAEDRARFERRLARLEPFVAIREARARWQLVASGALRAAVLARGRVLVEQRVLDRAEDVFFLSPPEYDEPTEDLRAAVTARRAEHRRWTVVTPPPFIGRPDPDAEPLPAGTSELRGQPGAPGVTTGPARVILELTDADRLAPGDVLVTTMTSPPWTPLLAVAAAVVTDAGDAMSHVAIAAREYGIPCVVGTHRATATVQDGQTVTVNGDRGDVERPGSLNTFRP